jgi:hypothetical protein
MRKQKWQLLLLLLLLPAEDHTAMTVPLLAPQVLLRLQA